jgi:MerR family transcriptional regulator, light-induced transcriptional regulator
MENTASELPTPPAESLLPIRTVSLLTGVNTATLRAWERRYKLITPQRTPKGHRLYTPQEVERINQILELANQGISVSHIKPLLDQATEAVADLPATNIDDTWENYQLKMKTAIENFDEPALDSTYNDALSLYPVDLVNQRLTRPLLHLLGERRKKRETGTIEERFFSVYLRNKLGARIHHVHQRTNGQMLLLGCLPGEQQEIGLLFFALAAVTAGFRVLTLGADTPLQQIPAVLDRQNCAALILSSSSKPLRDTIKTDLPALAGCIKKPVFVRGKAATLYKDILENSGIACLGENITAGLQLVKKTLDSNRAH